MAKHKITKRAVDATSPEDKDVYLWDTELTGFGLKVTPAGRRVYLVQYRAGGRTRRVTIGAHGSPWTPDEARQEAQRLLGEVAAGTDPAERKTVARKDLTVAELCDLYLAEGVATKKASTINMDRTRIERHVKPLLGTRKVRDLTRGDIERFMQDVASGKTAATKKTKARGRSKVTGGKGAASRTVGMVGAILAFAVNRGMRSDNPARGVKRYSDDKRERFLSPAELARLGRVLTDAEADTNPSALAAIRLLTLTGCRKAEILTLEWEHVDLDRSLLFLPDSKAGAEPVILGAPAAQLLSELPRLEGNPYVLPGASPGDYFKGLQKVWVRIRERAGLEDVHLHDLRHSFASFGAAGGDSLLVIGALLGHKHAATTQRYAHLSSDARRAAADGISGRIAHALDGATASGDDGAEVVSIRTGGKG